MRTAFTFLFTTLLISTAFAQLSLNDLGQLVNRTHGERTIMLTSFYEYTLGQTDSVAVEEILKRMKQLAATHNDDDLLLEAALVRTHYIYDNPDKKYSPEKIIAEVKKLGELADSKNALWLRIRAESLLGNGYIAGLQEYELGLYHLGRAAALMANKSAEEYPLKQVCNYHVGITLYDLSDFQNAILHLKHALQLPTSPGNASYGISISNTLGAAYRKLNVLDSSDHYFRLANKLSTAKEDTVWMAISAGNLGENLYLRGDFNAAFPLLRFDADVAIKRNDHGLASNAFTLMGDMYLQTGKLQKARTLMEQARHHAYISRSYKRLNVLYPRLAKLYVLEGRPKLATMFIDSALFVKDSLDRSINAMKMARVEQRLQMERMNELVEKKELQRSLQIARRNNVIGSLLLGILLASGLFYRHRQRTQLQVSSLEAKKTQAEDELKKATLRLNSFMEEVQRKNLSPQASGNASHAEQHRDRVMELQDSVILTDLHWRQFVELFEQVHQGFFQRLKTAHPDLTPTEMRFMTLSRMQLSNKEMAAMLAVGVGAIRVARTRIRQKLSLQPAQTIEELALGI